MSAHVIWKYELEIVQRQTIVMPAGAQILHVREQYNGINEVPTLWVSVLPTEGADAADEERTFEIVGIGGHVPIDGIYLGTTLCGQWVWHVYEIVPGISGAAA